jgi:hypothetical protein
LLSSLAIGCRLRGVICSRPHWCRSRTTCRE